MTAPFPFDAPEGYDSIEIDGQETPGLCTYKGGASRKLKIEDMQGIGFSGAYTVARGEELPVMDYEIHARDRVEYAALQVLAIKLRSAQETRPPKILSLVDLYLEHLRIRKIWVMAVAAIQQGRPGLSRWFLPIQLKMYQKMKPIGGIPALKPDPNAKAKQAVADQNARNEALRQQRDAIQIARGRGL